MIKVEIKWGVAILIAVIAVTIMILVVVNELSKDADKQFLNQNVEIGVQTHPNEGDDHTE